MTGSEYKFKYKRLVSLGRIDPSIVQTPLLELKCIEMINSLIAYKYTNLEVEAETIVTNDEEYLEPFIISFGYDYVLNKVTEQLNDIAFIVEENETDEYGDQFRSIVWKDQLN